VDDIIFGGSSHTLVAKFLDTMSREFEMSMMGELTFILGLQIKQTREGTFVHQGKYTKDVLKKFDMGEAKPLSTPMSTTMALDEDKKEEVADQKKYRSMIGSLLYLMATRPDIQFAVCLCMRFQSSPCSLIIKLSSGSLGTFVSHPSVVFGFWLPPLFLFAGIPMWDMLGVVLRGSPLRGLVNFLDNFSRVLVFSQAV
jgi:hypothetical protein